MKRPSNPAMDELLGVEVPVLDHGFVQLVDYMGTDDCIVQAARTSYGPSTRKVREDEKLLRFLMRHLHTSPFEMGEVKFRVKLPIFVARQWIRHRTANVNEMSLRYSEAIEEFHVPDVVREQSASNKQGSGGEHPDSAFLRKHMAYAGAEAFQVYKALISEGVAREQAREVLPVSTYTVWVWKIDVRNLLHFLSLRLDTHAQHEIRVYAEAIADMVRVWLPRTWRAFEDYELHAVRFSRQEMVALRAMLGGTSPQQKAADHAGLEGRERREFFAKLRE